MAADLLAGFGSVASFSTQVSRTTFKVGLGSADSVFAAFVFDEPNGLFLGHGASLVVPPCLRETGRQLQAHYFSIHYGVDCHVLTLIISVIKVNRSFNSMLLP